MRSVFAVLGLVFGLFILNSAGLAEGKSGRIINGVPVPKGFFREVIAISADRGAKCTATLVGPKVLITAAHCGLNGAKVSFQVDENLYHGHIVRSPNYPTQDDDVAAVIVDNGPVAGVQPSTVDTEVDIGEKVFILGYGCTESGGGGGNDGVLRIGESAVSRIENDELILARPDGAALCFGDSGGPVLRKVGGQYRTVGVASKGNIKDISWAERLGADKHLDFLQDVAETNKTPICGINQACEGAITPVLAFKQPQYLFPVKGSDTKEVPLYTLLTFPVDEVEWSLDSEAPTWLSIVKDRLVAHIPKDAKGEYAAVLIARKEGQVASTVVRFLISSVIVPPPTCTLVATPTLVEAGQPITLKVTTMGDVKEVSIEGVTLKGEKELTIKTSEIGCFVATAKVSGPGGSGACFTRYAVK